MPGGDRGEIMPYPRAHYYVLLCMAVTLAGFWPSYFSSWTISPWQFHAHGIAASLWVTMVFAQSWTVHHRQIALHRAIGKASLFLFPFLIGGLTAIIDLTGKGFVAANDPVRTMYGGTFLIGLATAILAYVILYYRALRDRRTLWLHAGYLLATPLILWESPFSRVLNMTVPSLAIAGPADFPHILQSIEWAMGTALLFCLAVRWRVGERAHPFAVAGALIAAEMIAMGFLGDLAVLRAVLTLIGNVPSATVVATGFAIGALTSWAGWQAGKAHAPVRTVQAA